MLLPNRATTQPFYPPEETTAAIQPDGPSEKFQPLRYPGLVLLLFLEAVSVAMYFLLRDFPRDEAMPMTLLLHTVIMISGAILLFSGWRKRYPKAQRAGTFIWLGACMFTCLALNLSEPIFALFAPWVNGVVTLLAIATVVYAWQAEIPRWGQQLLYFGLAISQWLCVYLAFYLIPAMPLAMLAIIFLGLGFYLLVPLIFSISIGIKLARAWTENRRAITAGLALPPAIVLFIIAQRWQVSNRVNQALSEGNSDLPAWVRVAQHLTPSMATWYYLGGELFYEKPDFNGFNFGRRNNRFARQVVHDPFFVIAAGVIRGHSAQLSDDDSIRALQAIFKNDHDSERRLWSGQDLLTTSQQTTVRVDPALRMARTEEEFEVSNTSKWGQQEAIYTFYLPEGSTVTDLSLWVNGVEEKGHLTTKGRAANAYNTIVGGERRDPSVVHWKEGNTVSVRIFPCTASEPRRFKIGFVSPLRLDGKRLVYESAVFDGPPLRLRQQDVQVAGLVAGQVIQLPAGFAREKGTDVYAGHVPGNTRWNICLNAETPPGTPVLLAGRPYRPALLAIKNEPFAAAALYFDLNAAWTASDFNAARRAAGDRPCYVWSGTDWEKLDDRNASEIFHRLCRQSFSLFPFYRLPDPASALVVTRAGGFAPRLADLRGSAFGDAMQQFCLTGATPRVFILGQADSPYLLALRELGVLQTSSGDPEYLRDMLYRGVFPVPDAGPNDRLLETAGLALLAAPEGTRAAPASDNLVRLVAYHDLMRGLGRQYFQLEQPEVQENWLDAARTAGVVSPVSSLVVLETQQDYERFDIDKPGNAADVLPKLAQSQSGSVPEPHEWALMALALSFMLLLWWKKW